MTLIEVANAAPVIPQFNGKINSQSKITFSSAAIRLQHIANLGAPSNLMINREIVVHIWKVHDGTDHMR